MQFRTELELGVSNHPGKWVNTVNTFYNDGATALDAYANTPCPASQLIQGTDEYDLKAKMGEMMLNYRDEEWLNEHLYPYL